MQTAESARQALEAAFPPTPLDTSHALDNWGRTYTSYERFEADTNGKSWTEIPGSVAEWHHDVIGFLDPPHFALLVPAFINAMIGQTGLDALPRFLCSSLTPTNATDEKFRLRIEALSHEQKLAIAKALVTVREIREQAGRPPYEFLDRALEAYWSEYATEAS